MICWTTEPWLEFLTDAIREQETGGETDPDAANGLAGEVGAYQITPGILKDLSIFVGSPWIGARLEDMRHRPTAEAACKAYLILWANRLKTPFSERTPTFLARIWNKGPRGNEKASSIHYGFGAANILATRLAGMLQRKT